MKIFQKPSVYYLLFFFALASRVWVAEDAYITFRMVENLYAGYGLVFNPGDTVEASTHPLWMMVLIVIRGAGLPLHAGSILAGLSFSLLALFLLARPALVQNRVPIAALALITVSGLRDFATAGMEFSLVFFLLVILWNRLQTPLEEKPAGLAGILALLYLTRPELALLAIYYGTIFLFSRALSFRKSIPAAGTWRAFRERLLFPVLHFAWPFALLAGSYHLFRYLYYGDIFPNTYYAKAGLGSYYSQGLSYLAYTILWSPALWLALFFFAGLVVFPGLRAQLLVKGNRWHVREAGAIVLLTGYIVKIGGDFMAFRFLLPEIVLFFMLVEKIVFCLDLSALRQKLFSFFPAALQALDPDRYKNQAGLILALLLLLYPVPLSRGYVADERKIFTANIPVLKLFFTENYEWGQTGRDFGQLQYCLNQRPFRISNSQAQARCSQGVGLGYFGVAAGPLVAIQDEQGLPSRTVAKQRVLVRWRPGHEHYVDLAAVLDFKALFCSSGEPRLDRILRTPAGVLLTLDPGLINTLPEKKVRLQNLRKMQKTSPMLKILSKELPLADLTIIENERFERKSRCWSDFSSDAAAF